MLEPNPKYASTSTSTSTYSYTFTSLFFPFTSCILALSQAGATRRRSVKRNRSLTRSSTPDPRVNQSLARKVYKQNKQVDSEDDDISSTTLTIPQQPMQYMGHSKRCVTSSQTRTSPRRAHLQISNERSNTATTSLTQKLKPGSEPHTVVINVGKKKKRLTKNVGRINGTKIKSNGLKSNGKNSNTKSNTNKQNINSKSPKSNQQPANKKKKKLDGKLQTKRKNLGNGDKSRATKEKKQNEKQKNRICGIGGKKRKKKDLCFICEKEQSELLSNKKQKWFGCNYCERWYHKECLMAKGVDLNQIKTKKWECLECNGKQMDIVSFLHSKNMNASNMVSESNRIGIVANGDIPENEEHSKSSLEVQQPNHQTDPNANSVENMEQKQSSVEQTGNDGKEDSPSPSDAVSNEIEMILDQNNRIMCEKCGKNELNVKEYEKYGCDSVYLKEFVHTYVCKECTSDKKNDQIYFSCFDELCMNNDDYSCWHTYARFTIHMIVKHNNHENINKLKRLGITECNVIGCDRKTPAYKNVCLNHDIIESQFYQCNNCSKIFNLQDQDFGRIGWKKFIHKWHCNDCEKNLNLLNVYYCPDKACAPKNQELRRWKGKQAKRYWIQHMKKEHYNDEQSMQLIGCKQCAKRDCVNLIEMDKIHCVNHENETVISSDAAVTTELQISSVNLSQNKTDENDLLNFNNSEPIDINELLTYINYNQEKVRSEEMKDNVANLLCESLRLLGNLANDPNVRRRAENLGILKFKLIPIIYYFQAYRDENYVKERNYRIELFKQGKYRKLLDVAFAYQNKINEKMERRKMNNYKKKQSFINKNGADQKMDEIEKLTYEYSSKKKLKDQSIIREFGTLKQQISRFKYYEWEKPNDVTERIERCVNKCKDGYWKKGMNSLMSSKMADIDKNSNFAKAKKKFPKEKKNDYLRKRVKNFSISKDFAEEILLETNPAGSSG